MLRTSRAGLVAIAAAVVVMMSGCANAAQPEPSESPTRTVPSSSTPTPTPTPDAGPAASFLLGGSELVVLDDEGRTVRTVALADAEAVVAAFAEVHGAAELSEPNEECGTSIARWFGGESLLVAMRADGAIVVVKHAGLMIEPSAGPRFGESAQEFADALPSPRSTGSAYVYDVAVEDVGGFAVGGTAFISEGRVESIASPIPPYGGDLC
jgi:hypothetical protein